MSKINLQRFIQDHYKSGITVRDVVREAITNSIQAHASSIFVNLEFSDPAQQSVPGDEPRRVLQSISITDDGEGFTDTNLSCFNEICTDHKQAIGGKGVGRLSYLKFAKKIQISSQLQLELIRFEYTPEFDLNQVVKTPQIGEPKTSVVLSDLTARVNTQVSTFVNSICEDLRLLLFLKKQKSESITLNFHHNSEQPFEADFTFTSNSIEAVEQKEFKFEGEHFTCYLFKDDAPKKGILAMLCADDLRVEEYSISKRFDICRYSIFISSPYFNGRSNMERQKLEIPQEESIDDLFTPINRSNLMPKIHDECMAMVNQFSAEEIAAFKSDNLKKLQEFYPYIKSSSLNGAAQFLDADQVVKRYRFSQAKKEDAVIESLAKGVHPSLDDISHLASEDLARYIVHRALVIDSLSNMPPESRENEIHKVFLPKSSNGENIYENNIWLIDDKFLSYSNVFSDQTIKAIVELVNAEFESTQLRKPDVAAFFTKNSSDEPNKLVVIEFKKPQASIYDNTKALQQCRLYANELVDKLPSVMEVFAFAIVEINDEFYRDLKQTNYSDIFSPTDRILYQSFKTGTSGETPLHLYVMPPTALLKDAKARNKVFEDILRIQSSS